MLPGLAGTEVRRTPRNRGVRASILMLAARDAIEDRVKGLDSGADDYLVKPFPELLVRLKALLRREPALTGNVLEVPGLKFDAATMGVSLDGLAIDLTAKEGRPLEYLIRHQNQVLTRKMIAEHLWNYDFDNAINVIDVQIQNLRRKIDGRFTDKLIQTVRGAGYRIAPPQ